MAGIVMQMTARFREEGVTVDVIEGNNVLDVAIYVLSRTVQLFEDPSWRGNCVIWRLRGRYQYTVNFRFILNMLGVPYRVNVLKGRRVHMRFHKRDLQILKEKLAKLRKIRQVIEEDEG